MPSTSYLFSKTRKANFLYRGGLSSMAVHFFGGYFTSPWPIFLESGLMCDDEGRLFDRPIEKPDGDTHVHEGGLFIVKIY